jgi:hypothetical protein
MEYADPAAGVRAVAAAVDAVVQQRIELDTADQMFPVKSVILECRVATVRVSVSVTQSRKQV